MARVQTLEGAVVISCVYFTHRRADGAIRNRRLSQAVELLAQFQQPGEVAVIGGDFNMTTSGDYFQNAQFAEGVCLLDWQEIHDEKTAPKHPVPAVAGRVGRRIDFLFGLEQEISPAPKAVAAGCSGAEKDASTGAHPSDHALVWVDLEL